MSLVLSHPTGNHFAREAAMGLREAGLLAELHLGIAACGNNIFSRIANLPGMGEIRRRTYDPSLLECLHLHPWREGARLLANRLGIASLTCHERGIFCVDAVYRSFDHAVAKRVRTLASSEHFHSTKRLGTVPPTQNSLSAVYAYEDGALETFRAAKAAGLRCYYDLPIAYWRTARALLEEEALRLPAWKATLVGTADSIEKCARKDAELELADEVICPSGFVYDSLPKSVRDSKPIHVIPFGSPEVSGPNQLPKNQLPRAGEPRFRILFAGSMTQRKGLADVFEAMKLLSPDQFELHVLGSPLAPMAFYRKQFSGFVHHATRPHGQVLSLMRSMDVFVLPSIVEGRALVQQEALSCGLPIIVTKNAGAEDLVADGRAGCLVPIRSPQAIAEKIEWVTADSERLNAMSRCAQQKARETTWADYRHQMLATILTGQR